MSNDTVKIFKISASECSEATRDKKITNKIHKTQLIRMNLHKTASF